MSGSKKLFGISTADKQRLLAAMRHNAETEDSPASMPEQGRAAHIQVSPELLRFDSLPGFVEIRVQQAVARQTGLEEIFYVCHDGLASDKTSISGKEYLNFSCYDYLGLNGDPRVLEAAAQAAQRYGMSASASRLTAGERPPHRQLERILADLYGVDDCICFVSGHATNMSTLGKLFGPRDVIFYDSLCHNSLVLGATLSGATRIAYPNNDMEALSHLLESRRYSHQRAIIVTEGLFGMDGCLCNLPRLVGLKHEHGCLLMVDEAHSLGVLGRTGRGVHEHFGLPASDVDIWMGTLSKTFCGCGGFIAGNATLVEFLKYQAPGFVYSVGMPPALAAASAEAARIMLAEPERLERLRVNSRMMLELAKGKGLDTGKAQGFAVIPIMVGDSLTAALLSQELRHRGVLALPIIYPGVEEGRARLRFFVSAMHTEKQLHVAVEATSEALPVARHKAASYAR